MSGYSGNLEAASFKTEDVATGLKVLGEAVNKVADTYRISFKNRSFISGFNYPASCTLLAGVPDKRRGLNLDFMFSDVYLGQKLPRKAKKAYIAKYGRAEYRKMYLR